MKYCTLTLLVLTILSFTALGQTKNVKPPHSLYTNEGGAYYLDTVIEVSNVLRADLYERFKGWYLANVRSASNNSSVIDDSKMMISDDLTIALDKVPGARINFKFLSKFKDGRCKVSFTSFQYMYIGGGTLYESPFEKIKVMGKKKIRRLFDDKFNILLESMISHLHKQPAAADDDW